VTAQWRKSTRSTAQGGDCVELARLTRVIGIRDSKSPQMGSLSLSGEGFSQLIKAIKDDKYDL
jgi:hypothetical protein